MKKSISIRIPEELLKFVEELSKQNFLTRTDVIISFIVEKYKYYKENEKEKDLLKSKLLSPEPPEFIRCYE